jgi:uncharacterized protein (TIGR00159 family)
MSWITFIDICVCAILLRILLQWLLANRQVVRLVLTLLTLFLVFLVINRLQLPLTQLLTTALALPLAFVLLLMHLPELRRAFQTGYSKRLFSVFSGEKNDISPAIIQTLAELARLRCGALIVLPGFDDIRPFISGGEEYEARVTESLLLSIFNTSAPRHDGAVIIQNNMITHVGAVLPLSTSESVKGGTRHRAALGLTEQCDATTLVVSEERGTISVARGGHMKVLEVDSFESISNAIVPLFSDDKTRTQREKGFRRFWGLWLAAIVLAFIASPMAYWLNQPDLQMQADKFIVAQVPISFKNIPENSYIAEYSADVCRVYFRVPSEEPSVTNQAFEITVDLLDVTVGVSDIELTERMLSTLPEQWEVDRYDPDEVRVVLAEARTVFLPIEPQITALKSSFIVSSAIVNPDSVYVQVKDNKPEQGRTIKTMPINLSRITEPGVYAYESLLEFPPSVRLLDREKDQVVNVRITIDEETGALSNN